MFETRPTKLTCNDPVAPCFVVEALRATNAALVWCVSNEERRAAKVDHWEAAGGPFANAFSVEDAPHQVDYSQAAIGPGNQLLKRDVPFERLAELQRAVLTYAVVHGGSWHEAKEWTAQGGQASAWELEFATLLDAVEPQRWLTVVDCHR